MKHKVETEDNDGQVCVCACVLFCWCGFYTNKTVNTSMLVDVRQCCRLLMFVYLPLFKTISLLLNLVNKESEYQLVSARVAC